MTELRRAVGPWQLMLYGVGSMLGAGIYGLIGKAAGVMGGAVWMAFLVAMVAAMFTGISYASIASRYPRAGGAAYVSHRAFGSPLVSYAIGLTVLCSGLSSIATQAKVIGENLDEIFGLGGVGAEALRVVGTPLPVLLLAIGFLLLTAGIVYRGITESLWVNAVCTLLEAGGLLLVIVVGMRFWGQADLLAVPAGPADGGLTVALLLQGSILTFFSFLGFEDMLNVAEEVERPERSMPIALIGAMLIASLIYVAVSITAVSVVPWRELAEAPGPLRLVIERAAPWFPAIGFSLITIAAVGNTALVNYVMGSRLLYGMAQQGLLPESLGRVHGARQTPHVAILVLLVLVVALQLAGDIEQLASATVLLLLLVFVLVNLSLVMLQRREGDVAGAFNIPWIVPAIGSLICAVMIVAQVMQAGGRGTMLAAGLLAAILLLYLVTARGRTAAIEKFASDN